MENDSVFSSDITRGCVPNTKELYDLINIVPARPLKPLVESGNKTDFQAKSGKLYIPKRKSKLKVKTVRNIRDVYEKDILSFLPHDLEKQQNYLLRKFRKGSSRDEDTKSYANKLLKSENPISRQSWQMLMNVNPKDNLHPVQFVLCDGNRIRVTGSRGGKTKFLCRYDLQKSGIPIKLQSRKTCKEKTFKKKLLENSVNVRFKPGPLSKKKFLDESYQKHQVGSTELVELPKPVIDIFPKLGVTFEPFLRNYLHGLRAIDGTITENWAKLAVTAVGSIKTGKLKKQNSDTCVTFQLNYKQNQKRILMRKNNINMDEPNKLPLKPTSDCEDLIEFEIKNVMAKILESVEISLNQDKMDYDEDDIRETSTSDVLNIPIQPKDKVKKKFTELDRLHVTVIELPKNIKTETSMKCENPSCGFGCICSSIECRKILRGHCARIECMFSCKCDHTMYGIENSDAGILGELINLDKQICSTLSKEEQKFHQTVVLSGEQSIILKSKRRNSKIPKKYDDFYNNLCAKTKLPDTKILSVLSYKLNFDNVEPWCMVHNLYKCFCGGKFVESSMKAIEESSLEMKKVDPEHMKLTDVVSRELRSLPKEKSKPISTSDIKQNLNPFVFNNESLASFEELLESSCARISPYTGRKYDNMYYCVTNNKIRCMEQNDKGIQKKLLSLVFTESILNNQEKVPEPTLSAAICISDTESESTEDGQEIPAAETNAVENQSSLTAKKNISETQFISTVDSTSSVNSYLKSELSNSTCTSKAKKPNLISWLENSYKVYKKRLEEGIVRTSLDPPKQGTMALYPWDFILTRYRESKNLFLVTKFRPYRIFLAVSMNHPFFKNCINIDEIRFADLHKYPITIKNLLTNVTNLPNHFYIFRGLSFCWELIGSVSKINETNLAPQRENSVDEHADGDSPLTFDSEERDDSNSSSVQFNNIIFTNDAEEKLTQNTIEPGKFDTSKWFVMTVENDFSEIQFYKKGFFVKYESIIKAIEVARKSSNTVRLSSQKCLDQSTTPPFGIYAIPIPDKYSVFIGPYEKNEPLGIETVKTMMDIRKVNRTRGVWITSNKIDNLKVIEKPLSFLPNTNTNQMVQLLHDDEPVKQFDRNEHPKIKTINIFDKTANNNKSDDDDSAIEEIDASELLDSPTPESSRTETFASNSKVVKPIQIRSYNGRLFIKKFNLPSKSKESTVTGTSYVDTSEKTCPKPIAEIAPQVKTTTPTEATNTVTRRPEGGMFILKPEEINKKLLDSQLFTSTSPNSVPIESSENIINKDIENFLATSVACGAPDPLDLLVDDDENADDFSPIWIVCTTVDNLGWIPGRRRLDGCVSFLFPGFKETPFYKEEEAFEKLNQVLERKVFIPKKVRLEWKILSCEEDLNGKCMLQATDLGHDFIITTKGIMHKRYLTADHY